MTFDPNNYLMDMRGKSYLEVKWRIVWFREKHPSGSITTELASLEPVVVKATIADETGRILATGFGTPKKQGVASSRPFEGAETAAIGRALAVAGFGTQFTGEEEGEHLADAPVESRPAPPVAQTSGNDSQPQEALLTYQDGSTVRVGNSTAARAEQSNFVAYVKAHEGNPPQNIYNLRAWVKKEKETEQA